MARLEQRIAAALGALGTLEELAAESGGKIVRDATIQRFEYSFEAVWKAAQAVLLECYGIELASPKPVVRGCFENRGRSPARLGHGRSPQPDLAHLTKRDARRRNICAIPDYRLLLRNWADRMARLKNSGAV